MDDLVVELLYGLAATIMGAAELIQANPQIQERLTSADYPA